MKTFIIGSATGLYIYKYTVNGKNNNSKDNVSQEHVAPCLLGVSTMAITIAVWHCLAMDQKTHSAATPLTTELEPKKTSTGTLSNSLQDSVQNTARVGQHVRICKIIAAAFARSTNPNSLSSAAARRKSPTMLQARSAMPT